MFITRSQKPVASNEVNLAGDLHHAISTQFVNLGQLKSTFGGVVLGMFNPGWAWLVCDRSGSLAVLSTFSSETLLVRSQRAVDATIPNSSRHSVSSSRPTGRVAPAPRHSQANTPNPASHTPTRAYSVNRIMPSSTESLYDSNATTTNNTLFPLMCLSVHEHAWMSAGYGVWGKEEYVKRFWSVVDWAKISRAYESIKREGS